MSYWPGLLAMATWVCPLQAEELLVRCAQAQWQLMASSCIFNVLLSFVIVVREVPGVVREEAGVVLGSNRVW